MMNSGPESPHPADDEQPKTTVPFRRLGGRGRRPLLISLTVCLCVLAAAVALVVIFSSGGGQRGQVAGSGSSPGASQAGTGQPTPSAGSSTAGSKPTVVKNNVSSDSLAKSVLTWPQRLTPHVRHWYAGPGGAALTAVQTEMSNAMQAAGVKLYVPMRASCAKLVSDIGAAESGAPIPVPALQHRYLRALTGLGHAAADCQAAISIQASGDETTDTHVNQALLNQARLEFAAMSAQLYQATGAIRSLDH